MATDLWVHELTTIHEIMDVQGPRSAVSQGGIYRFDDGRTCPDMQIGLYEYPGFTLEDHRQPRQHHGRREHGRPRFGRDVDQRPRRRAGDL